MAVAIRKKRRIFSEVEKQLLIQLVEKEKDIVELRQNCNKVLKEKKIAWDRILASFNVQDGIQETDVKTLKKVWDNLKTKAKKDVAKEKKDRHRTGGGPSNSETLADDASHLVSSICSEVLQPLGNDVDDDAGYHKAEAPQVSPLHIEQPEGPVDLTHSQRSPGPENAQASTSTATTPTTSNGSELKKCTTTNKRKLPTHALTTAVKMQEEEHELQMKRLKQQLRFAEEEHVQRMTVLKLHEEILNDLKSKITHRPPGQASELSDDADMLSLYSVYTQLS